jgi:hypothetical protein
VRRRKVRKRISWATLELSFLQTLLERRFEILPTRHNCPECSNQYAEFRQSQANRRSIHEHFNYQSNDMDQRIKNKGVHDRLGKRVHDQNWTDRDEEKEHVWLEDQWCPGGLTRSQKRRVQRLRNRKLEAQKHNRPKTWRIK